MCRFFNIWQHERVYNDAVFKQCSRDRGFRPTDHFGSGTASKKIARSCGGALYGSYRKRVRSVIEPIYDDETMASAV